MSKKSEEELEALKLEKNRKRKNRTRNREIRIVCVFFCLLMLAVMGNLARFVKVESEEAINNSYNPRQELLAKQNYRGNIISADGEYLAQTIIESAKSEYRIYPYQNMFAHVVGYATKGKTGIEFTENMSMIHSHASLGNKIQNEMNETKQYGDDVYTTLDTRLQKIAYDSLGVYKGAIVVSEPSTGKILAMVSKPDFDPNEIADLWDSLVDDNESTILLNRATQGLYPPGSTFKMVTALAYYRQNAGDVAGYHFDCNGHISKDGTTINCYHKSKHGAEDFTKSFAKSCNSSFANIGLSVSKDIFEKTSQDLLFNQNFDSEFVTKNSVFPADFYDTTDGLMQTSIGQGKTTVTPLLLNMITQSVANDGKCMKPYVVDRVESVTGQVVKQYKPTVLKQMMTPEEAGFLKDLMAEVVKKGTATKLDGLAYTACGKTGSAEFNQNKDDSHAWFTGFAPYDNPKICVTVIVESAGSGGDYAVPIVKRIMDQYFETNPAYIE